MVKMSKTILLRASRFWQKFTVRHCAPTVREILHTQQSPLCGLNLE